MDKIQISTNQPPLRKGVILDSSGKTPNDFDFDVEGYFKGATDIDSTRQKLLHVVKYLEKEHSHSPDIKKIYENLRKILSTKKDSSVTLAEIRGQLRKILDKTSPIILAENPKIESDEYKVALKNDSAARDLERFIYPLLQKHIEKSQKVILPHSKSGALSYPEKHSFFASTIQELTGSSVIDKVADKMAEGFSIEDALLEIEKENHGDSLIPQGLTHRLSKSFTSDPNSNFEVLFVRGGTYEDEKKGKFSKAEKKLSDAIKQFSSKCKKITRVTNPSLESIDAKLKAISERLKKNKTEKLYIVFNGHGDSEGLQEGVSKKNRHLQGAARFLFILDPKNDLTEEQIKELYNKYLKDIEVITIFDSCHSGAGITAIENKPRLDLYA